MCPCEGPKQKWFIDEDNDNFDNGVAYFDKFVYNPGPQYKIATLGPDCDDDPATGASIHKLNKCGKCEVEPVSGSCGDLPCNTFAERIKYILAHEGGYVNNPNDPGKETNKGITIAVWQKNAQSLLNIEPTSANLKVITDAQAAVLYKALYWDKIQAEDIVDGDIRYLLFDFFVNAGGNAVKVIQKTLNQLGNNLSNDGVIGDSTINAINNTNSVQLYNNFKANRQQYYNNLAIRSTKMATFLNGWTNRVNNFKNKTTTNNKNVNCN